MMPTEMTCEDRHPLSGPVVSSPVPCIVGDWKQKDPKLSQTSLPSVTKELSDADRMSFKDHQVYVIWTVKKYGKLYHYQTVPSYLKILTLKQAARCFLQEGGKCVHK